ncbi:hypothetical protein [Legionella sp. CNM-4043-24]|uniref:hypothetical protein n=1 Tax=Legionella sp. CNM-4043-24 TaxID=3421646 RepID=UPI00403A81C1
MKCNTADGFLNELSLANKRWHEKNDISCNWIFRGHNDSSYDLIPSLYRDTTYLNQFDKIIGDVIPGVPTPGLRSAISNIISSTSLQDEFKNRLENIIKSAFVEIRLIEEFLVRANSIGLPVPTLKLFQPQSNEISSVDYFYHTLSNYINNFIFIDKKQTVLRENFHPNDNNAFPYTSLVEFFFHKQRH